MKPQPRTIARSIDAEIRQYMVMLLLSVIAIVVFLTINFNACQFEDLFSGTVASGSEPALESVSSQNGTTMWRYTNEGWQDISAIMPREPAPENPLRRIHPMIWASSILLASISMTIWASSEWEVSRLFKK
jgi:hypothetical protein